MCTDKICALKCSIIDNHPTQNAVARTGVLAGETGLITALAFADNPLHPTFCKAGSIPINKENNILPVVDFDDLSFGDDQDRLPEATTQKLCFVGRAPN